MNLSKFLYFFIIYSFCWVLSSCSIADIEPRDSEDQTISIGPGQIVPIREIYQDSWRSELIDGSNNPRCNYNRVSFNHIDKKIMVWDDEFKSTFIVHPNGIAPSDSAQLITLGNDNKKILSRHSILSQGHFEVIGWDENNTGPIILSANRYLVQLDKYGNWEKAITVARNINNLAFSNVIRTNFKNLYNIVLKLKRSQEPTDTKYPTYIRTYKGGYDALKISVGRDTKMFDQNGDIAFVNAAFTDNHFELYAKSNSAFAEKLDLGEQELNILNSSEYVSLVYDRDNSKVRALYSPSNIFLIKQKIKEINLSDLGVDGGIILDVSSDADINAALIRKLDDSHEIILFDDEGELISNITACESGVERFKRWRQKYASTWVNNESNKVQNFLMLREKEIISKNLIIYAHGGPNGSIDTLSIPRILDNIAFKGVDIMFIDPSGSANSSEEGIRRIYSGWPGLNKDGQDVGDWVRKRGYEKVAIVGSSFGSVFALSAYNSLNELTCSVSMVVPYINDTLEDLYKKRNGLTAHTGIVEIDAISSYFNGYKNFLQFSGEFGSAVAKVSDNKFAYFFAPNDSRSSDNIVELLNIRYGTKHVINRTRHDNLEFSPEFREKNREWMQKKCLFI